MAWSQAARMIGLATVGFGAAALPACTPLRVVTHSVDKNEARVPPGPYRLDDHHWSIVFDVEHLKYSRFVMRFDKARATLDWAPGGLEASHVDVSIDAASVDTNVPLLDKLVKGRDMFDVREYPSIRFVSTRFVRTRKGEGELKGNLTIHGVTRPITLHVTFNGYGVNPLTKQDTVGFSARGHFDRGQFGLATWYPAVGSDVRVRIQAEFEKRTPS